MLAKNNHSKIFVMKVIDFSTQVCPASYYYYLLANSTSRARLYSSSPNNSK